MLPWKILFFFILFSGTFIAISAPSWMMAWMGLEINMLALLTLLMENKSPRSAEATLKYFLVQALASAILISTIFLSSFFFSSSFSFTNPFIIFSLALKLGSAPFHFWVPFIMEGLAWTDVFILLSWQKIAPFILIFYLIDFSSQKIIFTLAILSSVIGALGGLSQTSFRKIISFSSINHISWMFFALLLNLSLWASYFTIYILMLFILSMFMKSYNLSSVFSSKTSLTKIQMSAFFIGLFSFGGLPPFLGFIPKWFIISKIFLISWVSAFLLILMSLITLFFYLRMGFSSMLFSSFSLPSNLYSSNTYSFLLLSFNLSGLLLTPFIIL